MHSKDLCALGASTLPTRDLVAILLRHRARNDDLTYAEDALALVGTARDSALRSHNAGPQLLAAVELGRRAWMLPSPAGRRVRAPVDVAAIVAPRPHDDDDEHVWTLALDSRLTLARIERTRPVPLAILRSALAAGADRIVVASRRPAPAVPTSADQDRIHKMHDACAVVGVALVDDVILGSDGFCSALRLGLLSAADPRYG